jgi:hypothetical protein
VSDSTQVRSGAIQDTGNTVLDSTINFAMNCGYRLEAKHLPEIHKVVSELYAKEPKRSKGQSAETLGELAEAARSPR